MKSADITRLIPQRAPILMVERLLEAAGDRIVTSLGVRAGTAFVDREGRLAEAGIIEHIAQSASALAGRQVLAGGGVRPPVGYIGEVKKFRCRRLPLVGEEICTTVTTGPEVDGVTLIAGTACIGGETVAETQLKIYVHPQEAGEDGGQCRPEDQADGQPAASLGLPLAGQYYSVCGMHSDGTSARFRIGLHPGCAVYRGHFPGHPVCPGACHIQMVKECAMQFLGLREALLSVRQCRLTAVATPAACPELELTMDCLPTAGTGHAVTARLFDGGRTYMELKGELTGETPS